MPDQIRNETAKYVPGEFPYENVDYNNMEHVFWLKNTVVDSAITGILFLCPKGKLTYANKAALKIWGWDDTKNFLGNYAAKFGQSWGQLVDIFDIVNTQGSWFGEIGTVRKDGSLNTVHLQATLIRNTKGDPICTMCSFVDITDKKYYEEQTRIKECALASSINGMAITDIDGNILYVNDAFYRMWGGAFPDEVIGRPVQNFAGSEKVAREINMAIQRNSKWFGEIMVKRRDKTTFDVQLSVNTISNSDKGPTHVLYAFVDISDRMKAERELKKSHDQLEMRVLERTEELQTLNFQNIKEIEERKQAEKLLRQKEKDLIEKSQELEEMNAALKVLLKQREKDKEHLEKNIFFNIEKNIFPYINKLLNRKKIDALEREYILTIESHIKEVVSPFLRKLETTYQKLTPTEILVANLIRDAKSTKEIAQLLDTSIQTIEFHRKNIRQKLNLNNSKINLRSHLLSLM